MSHMEEPSNEGERRAASRTRQHQLHIWLDSDERSALARLEAYYRESGSTLVRRLIRAAAGKIA